MLAGDRSLQYIDFLRAANLADEITKSRCDFADKDPFTIFRHPNKVVLEVKTTVRAFTIIFHPTILTIFPEGVA